MPPRLAGRSREIERAVDLLARVQQFGTPAGVPLILTGPRGVGKTVVLGAVGEEGRRRGFVVVPVTLDRQTSAAQRIASAVARELARELGRQRGARWSRWQERLASFSVEVSVAGIVKIGARANEKDQSSADRDALVGLLEDSATLAREKNRPGLLLTVDELQEGSSTDLSVWANTVQDTVTAGVAPVVIVGAGLPRTPERLMEAATFSERFNYRRLDRLSMSDASLALLDPAATVHVSWGRSAAQLVLERAKGSPFLLQLFGEAAWAVAAPGEGGHISEADAAQGLALAEEDLADGMFRGRWNRATDAEQRVLLAIAQASNADGVATTARVSAVVGKSARQISVLRARLIDKGIIESLRHGELVFTMPGFEAFVLEQERPAG